MLAAGSTQPHVSECSGLTQQLIAARSRVSKVLFQATRDAPPVKGGMDRVVTPPHAVIVPEADLDLRSYRLFRIVQRGRVCEKLRQLVKTSRRNPNCRFQIHKRSQLLSACTIKRFPSSRCPSAIQIVRPRESTAETQPSSNRLSWDRQRLFLNPSRPVRVLH
jgi:hypothetical protein